MNIVENFFCIKSASWAYEKEWRAIHNVAGTLFGYEAGALTGVYFGPEVSQEGLEIIALIIQGQNPDVKLYRGERSKTEFKIVFNEFEYINHIEAKTMGLR